MEINVKIKNIILIKILTYYYILFLSLFSFSDLMTRFTLFIIDIRLYYNVLYRLKSF